MTGPAELAPGPPRGSSLQSWAAEADAAYQIARSLAPTPFVPDSLKLRSNKGVLDLEATIANVMAALLTGQELGFGPMASLRAIDVIPPGTGSPALRALALRALVQRDGHEIAVVESTETRAVVVGRRFGDGPPQESVWTKDRAAKLKPRGFTNPDGNWQKQMGNMLIARATAEVARLVAADTILGLPLISEEIGDEIDQPEPAAGALSPPAPRPRGRPKRARTAGGLRPVPEPPPAIPAGVTTEPGDTPVDSAGPGERAEPGPGSMITPGQRARLYPGMRRLGYTGDDAKEAIGEWLGLPGPIESSNKLTEAEADRVLDEIARREALQDAESARGADPDTQVTPDDDGPLQAELEAEAAAADQDAEGPQ